MKIWILCCGKAEQPLPGRCSAGEFEALCLQEAEAPIARQAVHPFRLDAPRLYVAPGRAARETAALFFPDAQPAEEPLLAPVPDRAFCRSKRPLPLWLWRLMAWLLRLFAPDPERKASLARADTLLDRLEGEGQDCFLICAPSFLRILLDRMRIRGYCRQRSGVFRLKPLERILLSRRDLHCGGCAHNCFLSNPGCAVGRDKARRQKG